MTDEPDPWPPAVCARCTRRVDGTRTVIEDHRATVVRVRVLCPDCYGSFLRFPEVDCGIRVFKAGDERRVTLDRDSRTGNPPMVRSRPPAGLGPAGPTPVRPGHLPGEPDAGWDRTPGDAGRGETRGGAGRDRTRTGRDEPGVGD